MNELHVCDTMRAPLRAANMTDRGSDEESEIDYQDGDGDTTVGPSTVNEEDAEEAEEASNSAAEEEDCPENEEEEETVVAEDEEDLHGCSHCAIPFNVHEAEVGVSALGRATAICPSCGCAQYWPFRDRERVCHLDEAFIRRQLARAPPSSSPMLSSEKTSTEKGN